MRLREHSQCRLIYAALLAAQGRDDGWVEMPDLVAASRSYNVHSRVDELRHKHGVAIENVTDVSVRPHVSKYRLTPDSTPLKTELLKP